MRLCNNNEKVDLLSGVSGNLSYKLKPISIYAIAS